MDNNQQNSNDPYSVYLELSDSSTQAHKFYELVRAGNQITVCFGRIGTKGQAKITTYDSVQIAQREAEKIIKEKLKKGYEPAVKGQRLKQPVIKKKKTRIFVDDEDMDDDDDGDAEGGDAYDKAEWHYGGKFPDDLDNYQAFVHTGMFLGWIIEHGLYNRDLFDSDLSDMGLIESFRKKDKTGAKIYEELDGVFDSEYLNDEGNAFTRYYFDFERGKYLEDYEALLVRDLPTMYHVQDTWENYSIISKKIDERYQEWKRGTA